MVEHRPDGRGFGAGAGEVPAVAAVGEIQAAGDEDVADAFGETYVIVLVVSLVAMLPTLLLTIVERRARAARETHEIPLETRVEMEAEAV